MNKERNMEKIKLGILGTFFAVYYIVSIQKLQIEGAIATFVVLSICMACIFMREKSQRKSLYIPRSAIVFCGFFIWWMLSGLWGSIRFSAPQEIATILCGLCVFGLTAYGITYKFKLRTILNFICDLLSIYAFLSIDAASAELLCRSVLKYGLGLLGYIPVPLQIGYEADTRMTGIFANSNVLGSILAIGICITVYLVMTKESMSVTENVRLSIYASILGVGFVLCFSLGAIVSLAIAFIIWVIITPKGERCKLMCIWLKVGIIAFLGAVIANPGLGETDTKGLLTYVAVFVAFFASFISMQYFEKPAKHPRLPRILMIVFTVVTVAYLITAFIWTAPLEINEDYKFRRVVLKGGTYTFHCEYDGLTGCEITYQNKDNLYAHTDNLLEQVVFDGEDFELNIPEDCQTVKFKFAGKGNIVSLTYTGTKSGKIPLKYVLLPEFMVNRIQTPGYNQNVYQRFAYFKDALKLFKKAPVIGNGLGAFEWKTGSVQDYYYESKYVHNVYLQLLCDSGIVGTALFLWAMALVGLKAFGKAQQSEKYRMFAVIVVFTLVHGATEVVFQMPVSLSLYASLYALIIFDEDKERQNASDCIVKKKGCPTVKSAKDGKVRKDGQSASQNLKIQGILITLFYCTVLVMCVLLSFHLNAYSYYRNLNDEKPNYSSKDLYKKADTDFFTGDLLRFDAIVNDAKEQKLTQKDLDTAGRLLSVGVESINYSLAQELYLEYGNVEMAKVALIGAVKSMRVHAKTHEKCVELLQRYADLYSDETLKNECILAAEEVKNALR